MHAVRRAAFRAASSVSSSSLAAASTSRLQLSSLAMRASTASVRPAFTLGARYFSRTARMAEEEQAVVDEATKLAETSEKQNATGAAPESTSGIYVSNMTWDAGENHLREAFSKFGTIQDITISRDTAGRSRGFGFVNFAEPEAAQKAVDECNQSFWHGRRLRVEIRKSVQGDRSSGSPRAPRNSEPTRSIYIGNIPYETSDADLNRLFRGLDNVTDVRVAVDRNTGWPRGFAHADFTDVESAIKAYEQVSQMELGGRNLRVDYSTPREPRNRSG